MKNILLLSPFFYPEPISTGKYNTILLQEICHEVDSSDVMCAHPIYPKWQVEVTSKQLNGVTALRGGAWLKFPSNPLLRRAVLELWFFFYVSFRLALNKKKYSHLVPIFPPSLFMLLVPLLSRKSKVVGIVHDLQSVYAKRDASLIKRFIFGAIKLVEARAFKNCEKLIFLSENMKTVAMSEYNLDETKCFVHYPFVTVDQFCNTNSLEQIIPNEVTSLVYSGALGEKQAPKKLAEFMSYAITNNPNLKAYIFSQGPDFEKLKNDYPSINFHSLVDEDDLPELLMRSSIQILPQETGTSDGSLPSKLPNLLASKCKILCITDRGSELVQILESYSRALVTNSWDKVELTQFSETLLMQESSDSDDKALLNMFTKKALIKRILD